MQAVADSNPNIPIIPFANIMNPAAIDPASFFFMNGQYYRLQKMPLNASRQLINPTHAQIPALSLVPVQPQLNVESQPDSKKQSPPQANEAKQPLSEIFQKNAMITSMIGQTSHMHPPQKPGHAQPTSPSTTFIKGHSMSPILSSSSALSARVCDAISPLYSPVP